MTGDAVPGGHATQSACLHPTDRWCCQRVQHDYWPHQRAQSPADGPRPCQCPPKDSAGRTANRAAGTGHVCQLTAGVRQQAHNHASTDHVPLRFVVVCRRKRCPCWVTCTLPSWYAWQPQPAMALLMGHAPCTPYISQYSDDDPVQTLHYAVQPILHLFTSFFLWRSAQSAGF